MKCRDILSIADEVIPTVEGVTMAINALMPVPLQMRYDHRYMLALKPHPFTSFYRIKIANEILLRVANIFKNLDASPRWITESRQKWIDLKDNSVIITSGDVRILHLLSEECLIAYAYFSNSSIGPPLHIRCMSMR